MLANLNPTGDTLTMVGISFKLKLYFIEIIDAPTLIYQVVMQAIFLIMELTASY